LPPDKDSPGLQVEYGDVRALLHTAHPGAFSEEYEGKVEQFRDAFFTDTETLNFEFIDTARIMGILYPGGAFDNYSDQDEQIILGPDGRHVVRRVMRPNPKSKPSDSTTGLAPKVLRFIREAQVNYRRFFSTTDPDLFPKILRRITDTQHPRVSASQLMERL
jgi:hypothetical protein